MAQNLLHLIYGTGNEAKLQSMRRTIEGLPIELTGMSQVAKEKGIEISEIKETGDNPMENARIKAEFYYQLFKAPVFSCDSGLYLWNYGTGELFPEEMQPGIHVRGREGRRLSDDELIAHYTGLVRKYGPILARYKNGISLILDREHRWESMEESLWGEAFLLTDKPHVKRIKGFPLDSISLEISSGKYYYDLEDNFQDQVAAEKGFRHFFEQIAKEIIFCGE